MRKIHPVQFKVTAEEKEKIKKLSENRGISMSQFILSRCLNADQGDRIEDMLRKILTELKGGR